VNAPRTTSRDNPANERDSRPPDALPAVRVRSPSHSVAHNRSARLAHRLCEHHHHYRARHPHLSCCYSYSWYSPKQHYHCYSYCCCYRCDFALARPVRVALGGVLPVIVGGGRCPRRKTHTGQRSHREEREKERKMMPEKGKPTLRMMPQDPGNILQVKLPAHGYGECTDSQKKRTGRRKRRKRRKRRRRRRRKRRRRRRRRTISLLLLLLLR
jgi:hypothetical protein